MKINAQSPIEVIVFDLDDTLLDTSSLLIPVADTPEFEKRIAQKLPLMPGALENLRELAEKYELFLLTQGNVSFQRQKIRSLGIENHFRECLVFQPQKDTTKGVYFQRILEITGLPPGHHLSIGNRLSTDIREAKRLGYQTCHFAHGEHLDEHPLFPEDEPDFTVRHHGELRRVCEL